MENINIQEWIQLNSTDILNPLSIIGIIIDVLVISFVIYKMLMIIKDTRAFNLFKGILFLILIYIVSSIFNFRTIAFLLDNLFTFAVLGMVIIFQPELRTALEKLGTGKIKDIFSSSVSDEHNLKITKMINEIVNACDEMSAQYVGGLIVIEKNTKVGDVINTGTRLNADVSKELVQNIFFPKSPLHDGAIIIRDNEIVAASCILPLTNNNDLAKTLGTRHRAALGITEVSDCIVVIVSEESGKISYALNGGLVRNLTKEALLKVLTANLIKTIKTKRIKSVTRRNKKK